MRTLSFFLCTLILSGSASAADTPVTTQVAGDKVEWPATMPKLSGPLGEPIQLFNGKDLVGWKWFARPETDGSVASMESAWSVRNGVMHVNGKPVATGYLRETQIYSDFVLIVEQRHVTNGGGGILVGITGPDVVWPKTLQVQGTFGDVGDLINQGIFKMTTDPKRTTARPKNHDVRIVKAAPTSEKPMGEWDTVITVVDHGTVTVIVNGVVQNTATDVQPIPGTVGLQSEGAEQEFRKIELRPILSAPSK